MQAAWNMLNVQDIFKQPYLCRIRNVQAAFSASQKQPARFVGQAPFARFQH
ncbi:hypothetical protein HMPREF9098_0207 [Kingella denitrificans ATCC 33394]|uniref:Uncharacterized protein n=1 Tax=Kingella denitrificans ATCC 33394 TaxID=888741 RepID=F0EWH3_9NEIS|nr:hypothetical protein HMPREF9098_0207 [Kingella denitrificans ATCC 33394]